MSSSVALLEGTFADPQNTLRKKAPPLPLMSVLPCTTEKLIPNSFPFAVKSSLGTPAEMEAYCKKLIDVVGKDSGFILSTGCTCPVLFRSVSPLLDSPFIV